MIPMDGLILFHGSYTRVKQIDLNRCNSGKDFGRGFYLTSDERQAQRFVGLSMRKAVRQRRVEKENAFGYVSAFRFHLEPSTSIYAFDTTDQLWLQFVAMNRLGPHAHFENMALLRQIYGHDLIVGKVANDQTNETITAYLSGVYGELDDSAAISFAVSRLRPDRLTDQYCFRSERGVSALEFMEAYRYDV